MRIAVDPGHGGRDPGASGHIVEAHYTYPWSAVLLQALRHYGHDAAPTHTAPGPLRKVSLSKRILSARKMGAELFVSVHANAYKKAAAHGAEVHIYSNSSPALYFAEKVLPALTLGIGVHGAGIVVSNFKVLRETSCPAILIEMGFVTNQHDAQWLTSNFVLQAWRVGEALDRAIGDQTT